MTGAHDLDVTTPNDFEVVCTRVFEAPARLVFDVTGGMGQSYDRLDGVLASAAA